MSSDPPVDLGPAEESEMPAILRDDASNHIIEIPIQSPAKDEPSNSENNSNSDSDDDDFPFDLTFEWLDEQMRTGTDLHPFLSRIIPGLPQDVSQSTMYEILMNLFLPIRQRKALEQYKTLDDAVELIRTRKNILVLTGAGISVSCGIPDFRSRNGIYARLREEFPELPNPQSMFDIEYFTDDPRPFFRFAKEIWPGQYQPSLAHHFISELERQDKLLRNYTQNIDSLEHLCPITRLIQCHGSFSSATCRVCHHSVKSDEIKEEILQQKIPHCPKCPADRPDAILKPDIVFFGEQLPDDFHKAISLDKSQCDLLIVMGSSLKVKPVSLVSELLSSDIPQILINRERLPHKTFDIELLGNCDVIINEICSRLSKIDPVFGQIKNVQEKFLKEIAYENFLPTQEPERKKQKLSTDNNDQQPSSESELLTTETSSSPKQILSSLKNSSVFNDESSYVYCPPRRYIFPGAEIDFSSDDDENDDDDDDDDDDDSSSYETENEEELPRKNVE
ncbi:unnamed protein product [Adineta ricciae]|uniref:protein acetyllysine N-acetyltransferase n=1 Tax=Adineta ricciae TaxID=249248 RepID=A0A813Q0L5_ADIRI|nr:unnamed protein product [Adineta ricciae]